MGDLVDLDRHRPHLVLDARAFGGEVHVYPLAYFLSLIEGKLAPDESPPPEVVRLVVASWLRCLDEHGELDGVTEAEVEAMNEDEDINPSLVAEAVGDDDPSAA